MIFCVECELGIRLRILGNPMPESTIRKEEVVLGLKLGADYVSWAQKG